jgi:hypothetical protein
VYGARGGFVRLGHGKVDEPRFGETLGYPASFAIGTTFTTRSRVDRGGDEMAAEATYPVEHWLTKRPTAGLIHHSDRSVQYCPPRLPHAAAANRPARLDVTRWKL